MTKRKFPSLTDLGNGLAIEALQTLNVNSFTVSASLSIDHPETINNFAQFANVLELAHQKGVDSILKPMDERQIAAHAITKQATDIMVMQSSLLVEENTRLKDKLADMELALAQRMDESRKKMFAQKPVARLELREPRTDGVIADYYDVVILNRAQCHDGIELFGSTILLSDITSSVIKDAARWVKLLDKVGAESSGALPKGEFVVRRSHEEYKAHNLMKGSVSQHLTEYIDRLLTEKKE